MQAPIPEMKGSVHHMELLDVVANIFTTAMQVASGSAA